MTYKDLMTFAAALADFYRSSQADIGLSGAALQAHRDTLLAGLEQQLVPNPEYQPASAPVVRFLPETLAAAPPHLVLEAILPFIAELHWQTNNNYRGHFPDSFFDNEAFTEIIGPKGKLQTDAFRCGLLLLGPQVDYPDHNHETSEWYLVLSGTGLWRQGHDDFSLRAPHSAIFHASWEVHAMRCKQAPVLALWSWAGKMGSEAVPV